MAPPHDSLSRLCDEAAKKLWSRPEPQFKVTDRQLKAMSIIAGQPLDLDNPDSGYFFRPTWRLDQSELGERIGVNHLRYHESVWPFCDESHHSMMCAHSFGNYFISMADYVRRERDSGDGWTQARENLFCKDRNHYLPLYDAIHEHPKENERFLDGEFGSPQFWATKHYYSQRSPHVGALLTDSSHPEDNHVSRGELVTAVALLRHQLSHERIKKIFAGHTIPVIIFNIGHTDAARITEFHYDFKSECLVYRQSPVLHFTPDIRKCVLSILRLTMWMDSRPVGVTSQRGEPERRDAAHLQQPERRDEGAYRR